jgi:hypothetical protein
MKTCTSCNATLPLTEFYPASKKPGHLRGDCKACHKAHRRANTDRRVKQNGRLQATYGITVERYEQMLEAQGGVCAICGEACVSGRKLAVDHDHATNKVRGLLCCNCNRALGLLKDSPARLRAAHQYLTEDLQPSVNQSR